MKRFNFEVLSNKSSAVRHSVCLRYAHTVLRMFLIYKDKHSSTP